MSENLGNKVAWASEVNYGCGAIGSYCSKNDKGPITAINHLDGLTDEEWSNITPREYTYSGIAEDGLKRYEDITRTMRARMLTYEEAKTIKTANNGTMPAYMCGKYWTSTVNTSGSGFAFAWNVYDNGVLGSTNVNIDVSHGVRPVIELSK